MRTYSVVPIFGLPISRMNMQETIAYLSGAVREGTPHQVITINPIMIMDALARPDVMEVMQSADLLVPDGTGVVWAAQRMGQPVKERVAGFDLMQQLLREANEHGWRVYLLGAAGDVIQAVHDRLQRQYPGAQLVGCRDGYFTDADDESVVQDIRAAEPHLLFVARSADKQEPWLHRYREQLNVPVMMGVGGSFDVLSGRLKRAPLLWQKLRLEWLYRLVQEPWRYKRMLALPKFVWKVLRGRDTPQAR